MRHRPACRLGRASHLHHDVRRFRWDFVPAYGFVIGQRMRYDNAMPALVAQSLSKSFPIPAGELVVLEEASLALERGQSAAILGPSGSGKSTLLSILGTLDQPSAGSYELAGTRPF